MEDWALIRRLVADGVPQRQVALVAAHDRAWARGMTTTDPAHVAVAKVLREQFQRPRPAPDPHDGLLRDLTDYDRAFGLIDGGLTADTADGEEVA
jgi:hypothetical protein